LRLIRKLIPLIFRCKIFSTAYVQHLISYTSFNLGQEYSENGNGLEIILPKNKPPYEIPVVELIPH
jgi:hypothetical protein